jgi:N-acetylglucosaminyl-diphospho-decaprenol L-rhamnosyltransferase
MTIAVIIIAAGRRDHLRRTLHGLRRQTRRPDDVVVVDMRPEDPVAEAVRAPARTVPLTGGRPAGEALPLATARNLGAASTATDRLVFLDVDCLPDGRLVERYDAVLRTHRTAIACGPVRYLQQGWGADPDAPLEARGVAPSARPVPAGDDVRLGDDHELFWSLSFGVDRHTWDRLGGFDEGYRGYGGEDTDLAFRARSLGIPLAWFGGGTAHHQWHRPTRLDPRRTGEIVANARRFHDRWGHWPMTGWLTELAERGLVHFDPSVDDLRTTEAVR